MRLTTCAVAMPKAAPSNPHRNPTTATRGAQGGSVALDEDQCTDRVDVEYPSSFVMVPQPAERMTSAVGATPDDVIDV
jgi:hypothetical protein